MKLIERFQGLLDDIPQRLDSIRELQALLREMIGQLSETERQLNWMGREVEAAAKLLDRPASRPKNLLSLDDGDELISVADLARELKISRTTLHSMRKRENFPQPVSVSQRRVAFRRSDVRQWLAKR